MNIYYFFTKENLQNRLLLYIGSTKNVKDRIITHKCDFKRDFNKLFYIYLRDNNLNFDDLFLEVFEVDVDTMIDLRIIEQDHIDFNQPLLNKHRAYCSEQERKQDNKEYAQTEKSKEYKREYNKEYNQINKNKINEQRKEYREINKDKIKEQKKEYYQANKDKIIENQRERRLIEI